MPLFCRPECVQPVERVGRFHEQRADPLAKVVKPLAGLDNGVVDCFPVARGDPFVNRHVVRLVNR